MATLTIKDGNGSLQTVSVQKPAADITAWSTPSDGTNPIAGLFDLDTGAGSDYQLGFVIRISASGGSIEAKGQQVMASSIPVVIANNQTAIPVSQSGSWTVTTSGTATVSGTVTANQGGSWTVTANAGTNLNTSALALEAGNLATLAGAVTASKFQCTIASALPAGTNVIGHVIVDSGTITTLTTVTTVSAVTAITNALPSGTNLLGKVGIDQTTPGTTNAITQPDARATAQTINSATSNAAVTVNLNYGEGVTSFNVVGLTASGATLTVEASDNGTAWFAVNGIAPATGILFTTLTTDQSFRVNTGGRTNVRLRVSATGTGTLTIDYNASSVSSAIAMSSPLPAGTNLLGKVGIDQTTPGTTNAVAPATQKSVSVTLQNQATANANGTIATTDGLNGAQQILISNGAGTCTVTLQGSLDNFATAQDILTLGVYKLTDSGAGTNTNRSVLSGAITVAANTSYLYAITDIFPYVRAVISAASGLGAGSTVTGCTVKLYSIPV